MTYKNYEEMRDTRDKYYYTPRKEIQDRAWVENKRKFLDELRKETKELVERMKEKYPDIENKELIELIDETYSNTFKRDELMLYRMPQYAKPYTENPYSSTDS